MVDVGHEQRRLRHPTNESSGLPHLGERLKTPARARPNGPTPGNRRRSDPPTRRPAPRVTGQNPRIYWGFTLRSGHPEAPFRRAAPREFRPRRRALRVRRIVRWPDPAAVRPDAPQSRCSPKRSTRCSVGIPRACPPPGGGSRRLRAPESHRCKLPGPTRMAANSCASLGFAAGVQGCPQGTAELGGHPRSAHRPPTRVCDLAHVHGTGHVGVTMTEQERDLVHALAG